MFHLLININSIIQGEIMGLFRYILGGEGRRNLKRLDKLADRVLSLDEKYSKFTDEELKEQTSFLRNRLNAG